MYKQLTAQDLRKFHNLPDDYKVDGMFIAGTYKVQVEAERLRKIAAKFGKFEMKNLEHDFLAPGYELKINGKIIWFFVVYGGTILSEYLHVGSMLGSKMNILSGVCGGLKPGAKAGEFIVPTQSSTDGSTATMYDRTHQELQPSDPNLRGRIVAELRSRDLTVHEGKTVTCQAMLAETWEDVEQWSGEGYLGVEMEASTVFAVSNHFGVPSTAILSIADNLIEEQTVLSENYENERSTRNNAKDIQFEVALTQLLN